MVLLEQVFDVPIGIRLLNKIPFLKNLSFDWKNYCHQFNVLLLTFLAYASYHLARKPTSVVKNVLHQKNCSALPPPDYNITGIEKTWCSWHPFDGSNADTLLGALDSAFLFAYAFGMYFTGSLGERINVRIFLSLGMLSSALFGLLFGVAYWANIHSLAYFIIVQILAGFCQSTGWPGCVAVVGNWFGKSKRGMIMGVWRAHHSVGNILGTLIAGIFVDYDWGLSFAVPAAIIGGLGITIFLLLVPDPRAVGCRVPDHSGCETPDSQMALSEAVSSANSVLDVSEIGKHQGPESAVHDLASNNSKQDSEKAISFWQAIRIPGVCEYAFSLFFAKLINYTFLYWLPRYIKDSGLAGNTSSADLSTLFDVGGIFGGIIAGLISDLSGKSASTCAGSFILSIPMLFIYRSYGSDSVGMDIFLLFIVGLLVNGPYALITTAVSADLGTHPDLKGSSRALATVTAIIDGTGSIGAAIGPLMAGPLSSLGWDYVFYALMIASALGCLLLSRLIAKEWRHVCGCCNRKQAFMAETVLTSIESSSGNLKNY